jgi:hypothetical protein
VGAQVVNSSVVVGVEARAQAQVLVLGWLQVQGLVLLGILH